MKTMKLVSLVSVWAICGVPLTALALEEGECRSDEDCAEGASCEKAQWVAPCGFPGSDDGASDGASDGLVEPSERDGEPAPGEDGTGEARDCDTEVHEEEIGRCVTPPEPCTEDVECGEYEVCRKVSVGVSCPAEPSDGSEDDDGSIPPEACPDLPDQEEVSGTCGPGTSSCEQDTDCPREFECAVVGGAGSDVSCACVTEPCDCDEQSVERKACQPKVIECENDDPCPSDWVCHRVDTVTCSGGGAEPGIPGDGPTPIPEDDAGGADTPTAPSDGEGADPVPAYECTTTRGRGQCLPRVWKEGGVNFGESSGSDSPVSSDDGGGDDSPPPRDSDSGQGAPGSSNDSNSAGGEAESGSAKSGGCAVGPKFGAPSPGLWVIAIGAASLFVRRRRRSL